MEKVTPISDKISSLLEVNNIRHNFVKDYEYATFRSFRVNETRELTYVRDGKNDMKIEIVWLHQKKIYMINIYEIVPDSEIEWKYDAIRKICIEDPTTFDYSALINEFVEEYGK